jgi:hypothetical protein
MGMPLKCYAIKNIILHSLKYAYQCFVINNNITTIDQIILPNCTHIKHIFYDCPNLESINILDIPKATSCRRWPGAGGSSQPGWALGWQVDDEHKE